MAQCHQILRVRLIVGCVHSLNGSAVLIFDDSSFFVLVGDLHMAALKWTWKLQYLGRPCLVCVMMRQVHFNHILANVV